jgi:hypothetical protein
MMNRFYKEEPSETRMFPCPACHEIIAMANTSCRFCGVPVDAATAQRLNSDFRRVTDAVTSANTFKQSIWVAVLLTVAGPLILFGTHNNPRLLLLSVAPVGFLGYAVSWQRKYGSLETQDRDYPGAVRAMRVTLVVWAVALFFQLALLAYAFSSGTNAR